MEKMNVFVMIVAIAVAIPYASCFENVALNKRVNGVRLLPDGRRTWAYLTDGDPNTCADSGPRVDQPAFRVDLGQEYTVTGFKLVFRSSKCPDTISGTGCGYLNTLISVGDGVYPEDDQECRVIDIERNDAKGEKVFKCSSGPVTGRYVTLTKRRTIKRAIYLCELEVYGEPNEPYRATTTGECKYPANLRNVARGKRAAQSSDQPGEDSEAANAVDGDYNGDATSGSCSWTDTDYEPWWRVDLRRSYDIYYVKITNRDDCCSTRIKDAEIRIGDSRDFSDNPVCGSPITRRMARQNIIEVECGCDEPLRGRYVSIQVIGSQQQLHMCEVEVMAK